MKTLQRLLLCLVLLMPLAQCASALHSDLEDAQFALDNSDYETAIEKATNALNNNPNNLSAARILASAYLGRSGIRFLAIADDLVDLDDSAEDNFAVIGNALPEGGDLGDLRLAIETLESLDIISDIDNGTVTSITDDLTKEVVYELGMAQAIEHYAIGVYQSAFKESEAGTATFAPEDITADGSTTVQDDLLTFDNRLSLTVTSQENLDMIADIRQTYCILDALTPATAGFTRADYQAMVACQLTDEADRPAIDFTQFAGTNVASCDDVKPDNQPQAVQDCYDEDTTL